MKLFFISYIFNINIAVTHFLFFYFAYELFFLFFSLYFLYFAYELFFLSFSFYFAYFAYELFFFIYFFISCGPTVRRLLLVFFCRFVRDNLIGHISRQVLLLLMDI